MNSFLKNSVIPSLRIEEGFRSKPYKCANGRLTIGFGRNLDDNGITRDEAEYLLQSDVERIYHNLHVKIPFFADLPTDVQHTLLDMAFNLGVLGLLRFTAMLRQCELGQFDKAADCLLQSLYARQLPARANRNAERMRNA